MSRIKNAFDGKKAFIGFVTAGDPSLSKTEEFVLEMEKAGASLIELGIPFSDPIAEGVVIQQANIRRFLQDVQLTRYLIWYSHCAQKRKYLLYFLHMLTLYINTAMSHFAKNAVKLV